MVRHWILIPAFPGSNPGSAVKFKDIADAVSFFVMSQWRHFKSHRTCHRGYPNCSFI